MSKKQWGHGYNKGRAPGKKEIEAYNFMANDINIRSAITEICKIINEELAEDKCIDRALVLSTAIPCLIIRAEHYQRAYKEKVKA